MPVQRAVPVPTSGTYFLDARGAERALRVSWHLEGGSDDGLVVLSLWRENVCTGSFRLAIDDVADLVQTLSAGLGDALSLSRRAAG